MKKMKRLIAGVLVALLLVTGLPVTPFSSFIGSSSVVAAQTELVYGNGQITRAQWLHNLVVVFDMTVEEEALPDNYFTDVPTDHPYYKDILLAVEFGVVTVEEGTPLQPDGVVTRDFAVTTLNFCLGYQTENTDYTFSDYDQCSSAQSAQIAVDRNWVTLNGGKFSPQTPLTSAQAEFMLNDAVSVLDNASVDPSYDSKYTFASDVTVIPAQTTVWENDGVVFIEDCPQSIEAGEKFAVYYGDLPVVYIAESVTKKDGVTQVVATEPDNNEGFTQIDAQGQTTIDALEFIPEEGVTLTVEEEAPAVSTFAARATQKISNIKAQKKVTIMPGVDASLTVAMKNPYVEYSINSSYAYVALNGNAEISYHISADALAMTSVPKSFTLFTCNVAGVGSFDIKVNLSLSGSASGTVKGYLVAGVECSKGSGIRAVKCFTQSGYYSNIEATAKVGLRASLGVTKLPVLNASVYAEIGAQAKFTSDTYQDGSHPYRCTHFNAYMYAYYGATAGVDFLGWKKSFTKNFDIFTAANSPVRIVHHYEDGVKVTGCTRGKDYGSYFTNGYSRWGGSGWISGDGAYGLTADGIRFPLYEYTVDENGNATITKYKANSWSVYIPKEIDGHKVVAIGSDAFSAKRVAYVVVPEGVTHIGIGAFINCTALTNVTLPSTLTSLGGEAFGGCTALSEVNIPKGITEIPAYDGRFWRGAPFSGCQSLRTVSFEEGITTIKGSILANTGLVSVTIPDTVTVIENSAFSGCDRLRKVTLSKNLTSLGIAAFSGCSWLEEITLPATLTSLGGTAFKDCISLARINIPKGITDIPLYDGRGWVAGPFAGCAALNDISFEQGITEIRSSLFNNCNGLIQLTIPDTVTKIGDSAFSGCTALESMVFSKYITAIGYDAFTGCIALKEAELPTALVTLCGEAFENCTALTKVVIPKKTTDIPLYNGRGWVPGPFKGCSALQTVIFEEGATEVPNNMFEQCGGPMEVTLPDTVTQIKNNAFKDATGLISITIPKGLTSIGDSAFKNCKALEKISLPDTLSQWGSAVFYGCSSLSEVNIPTAVSNIPDSTFEQCKVLTKMEVPKGIASIGNNAFGGCSSLESVTLSKEGVLTSLGDGSFYGCEALASVELPETLKSIGKNAFQNCFVLTEISIPQSTKKLGEGAFKGCRSLKKVSFTDYGITALENETFMDCPALETMVLPKGLQSVGHNAFLNDVALTGVTVPPSVETIQTSAFSYPDKTTIYGRTGSYAQTYANENNHPFVDNTVNLTKLEPKESNITLEVGETKRIELIQEPADHTEVITLTADNGCVSIQGMDITAKNGGTAVITATATDGAVCTVTVEVLSVQELEVVTPPDKTVYQVGEEFDPTGLVVQAVYSDGSLRPVTDYVLQRFDSSNPGTLKILVEWTSLNGWTYTASFDVTVEGEPLDPPSQPVTPDPPVEIPYGDVSGDEKIDATDALNVLKAAVGKQDLTEEQKIIADVNGDEKLDAVDALLVLQFAVGKIDQFPVQK